MVFFIGNGAFNDVMKRNVLQSLMGFVSIYLYQELLFRLSVNLFYVVFKVEVLMLLQNPLMQKLKHLERNLEE